MFGLLRRTPHERTGFVLYGAVVSAARDPYYYAELAVPDTLDGRFDLVGLHSCLVIRRLRLMPPPGPALAQAVFDAMFSDMDINLRELGVSDLSVGKRVRAMWEAFHGRAVAYENALAAEDLTGLAAALARNVWRGLDPADGVAERLAHITMAQDAHVRPTRCRGTRRWDRDFPAAGRDRMIKLIASELPQTIRYDAIPPSGCDVVVEAVGDTLDALAQRMGIPAVLAFSCHFELRRGGVGSRAVVAEGHLQARVVLTCVITLDSFEQALDERFDLRFVPLHDLQDQPDPEAVDEVPYEDGVLAVGEAAAEQLALSLPAFPRRPGAENAEEAGFLAEETPDTPGRNVKENSEQEASPFAVLTARQKPM